jgi:hypothetical protein
MNSSIEIYSVQAKINFVVNWLLLIIVLERGGKLYETKQASLPAHNPFGIDLKAFRIFHSQHVPFGFSILSDFSAEEEGIWKIERHPSIMKRGDE